MEAKNEIDVDHWMEGEQPPRFSPAGGRKSTVRQMLGNMSDSEIEELARLLAPAIDKVNAERKVPVGLTLPAGPMASLLHVPRPRGYDYDEDEIVVKVEEQEFPEGYPFGDTAELERKQVQQAEEEFTDIFGESTYTLFYMCEVTSVAFRYALFVYTVQMASYILTLVDIVDWASTDNPIKIPPMVDTTVTLAQAVCLLQTLAFQSDLIEAVLKLQDGFYPEAQEHWPGATFNTWLFSCITQLSSALCLLLGNFILTFQVDDVVELMLNFVALNFMAEIDDFGFYIARMGFISDRLQKETEAVADFKLPKRQTNGLVRKACYLGTTSLLFVGYFILKTRQLRGEYLQSHLYVQFGDAYNPKIPFYSGILATQQTTNFYRREYRDIGTKQMKLAYCDRDRVWAFSDTNESDDPCDYFAKSRETDTFDVTQISNNDWVIKDEFKRFKPFETFTLIGRDCDPGVCQGTCVDKFCVCEANQFGLDCEFDSVCPELVLNTETPEFTPHTQIDEYWGPIPAAVSGRFELLKNDRTGKLLKIYNMPVYYSDETYPANIIFFGGRRWVLSAENSFHNITALEAQSDNRRWYFKEETIALLESGDFHGYNKAKFIPLFLSDPVDFETPYFLPTPAGLGWNTVSNKNESARLFEPASPVATRLLCTICTGDHGGYCESDGGSCNATTGVCDCKDTFTGAACEKRLACYEQLWPCSGDGICDEVSGLCRCNPPYFGATCEGISFCTEAEGKCYNGGTCDNETGLCQCSDDPMIFGDSCQKRAQPAAFGCENGGTYKPGDTECTCKPPFYGQLCSLVDTTQDVFFCDSNEDCSGETTCNITSGICDCGNTTRYGTLCEYTFDCRVNDCMNLGVCNTATGICDCEGVYYGHDCSKVPDCVTDDDCMDGVCNNSTGHCWCDYISDFGKLCQIRPRCTQTGFCLNGGSCNAQGYCQCPTPYGGPNCEFVLSGVEHQCLECAANGHRN